MRAITVIFALLVLGACASTPSVDVTPSVSPTPRLAAVNPIDIAVLPVHDNSVSKSATWLLADMREAAEFALPGRRYSPLGSQYVDARLVVGTVEASLRQPSSIAALCGRFEEDAILAIMVNRWDDRDVMRTARVKFDLEAALIGGEDRQTLWSGRLEGSIKAGGDGPAPLDRQERSRDVAKRAVDALIDLIDERR
eukprot:jgi/Undpi1/11717/HiC_scaffold_37.g14012.m1